MQQKTTYLMFLFIGVIFEIFFFSCKRIIDPVQVGTFVYVNKLSFPIKLKISSTSGKTPIEYEIASSDSVSFTYYADGKALPFNTTGGYDDLANINFGNGKCTKYKKEINSDNGTGVYLFSLYENFSPQLIDKKSFTLRYFINQKDFSIAQNCN